MSFWDELSYNSSFLHALGVARGTGWQHIGAYVNLGAYYLVGIPVAALLCFGLHFRGKGLWIGILTGSSLQLLLLALVTSFTNWQKQVSIINTLYVHSHSFYVNSTFFLVAIGMFGRKEK